MRNYMRVSTHVFLMTAATEHMIGTPLLCGDAGLNIIHNTVQDAQ